MHEFKDAAALLPKRIKSEMLRLPNGISGKCEEIRLRTGYPVSLVYDGTEHSVLVDYKVVSDDIEAVIEKASGASLHSVENNISKGFLYVDGGIRVGVCGTAVIKENGAAGLRDFSSVAIRIPHEIRNCGAALFKALISDGLSDILIISPPGAGKTTCIREYIRIVSNLGFRVSLIDQRGEVAGIKEGTAQFDVGSHTDIMNNAPKRDGAIMMLRAMNPQLIAMDEISSPEDVKAIEEVSGCGVKILATAHAKGVQDLAKRPVYKDLLEKQIFSHAIIIENISGARSYRAEKLC